MYKKLKTFSLIICCQYLTFLAANIHKTKTITLAPIVNALQKAQKFAGIVDSNYFCINDRQSKLKEYMSFNIQNYFTEKELRSWADNNADTLNKILKSEGFNIKLQQFKKNEFGVVSILEVINKWLETSYAEKYNITYNGQIWLAVKIKNDFKVYRSAQHQYPILSLETESHDTFYMTIADNFELNDFKLLDHIKQIEKGLEQVYDYNSVIFPMITLDQEADISWLLKMGLGKDDIGNEYIISQAKQQTKFKMNEFGAIIKSAVAIAVECTSIRIKKNLIIDKPFYLWIKRDALSFPILCAFLYTDCWSNLSQLD